jgi:hypothetical protein
MSSTANISLLVMVASMRRCSSWSRPGATCGAAVHGDPWSVCHGTCHSGCSSAGCHLHRRGHGGSVRCATAGGSGGLVCCCCSAVPGASWFGMDATFLTVSCSYEASQLYARDIHSARCPCVLLRTEPYHGDHAVQVTEVHGLFGASAATAAEAQLAALNHLPQHGAGAEAGLPPLPHYRQYVGPGSRPPTGAGAAAQGSSGAQPRGAAGPGPSQLVQVALSGAAGQSQQGGAAAAQPATAQVTNGSGEAGEGVQLQPTASSPSAVNYLAEPAAAASQASHQVHGEAAGDGGGPPAAVGDSREWSIVGGSSSGWLIGSRAEASPAAGGAHAPNASAAAGGASCMGQPRLVRPASASGWQGVPSGSGRHADAKHTEGHCLSSSSPSGEFCESCQHAFIC